MPGLETEPQACRAISMHSINCGGKIARYIPHPIPPLGAYDIYEASAAIDAVLPHEKTILRKREKRFLCARAIKNSRVSFSLLVYVGRFGGKYAVLSVGRESAREQNLIKPRLLGRARAREREKEIGNRRGREREAEAD